ncbi:hypothetical protein PO909_015837 [Leuciscus waleckii]
MLKLCPDPTAEGSFSLNQLKFRAGGFESLMQFRVTESPSTISPDRLTDTDVFWGGSRRKTTWSLYSYPCLF